MKPRLAVVYGIGSFSPFEIITAVGDTCDLIWVITDSQPSGPMSELLSRTGTVVDIAGLSSEGAVAEVARAHPEGIIAFSDAQLSEASMLADRIGLRFNNPTATRRFLDKYEQRMALRASGVAVPGFVLIRPDASATEILALTNDLVFPTVLKPRRGSSSRDTYHAASADALVEMLAPPRGERLVAREDYLVEEYLPDGESLGERAFADYVSVESVVAEGRIRHLCVTGKFPLSEPYRETGNFMPCELSSEDIEAVTELTTDALTALDAEHGCFHTETKLTPAGPRIIESNARVGGGGIEDLFVMSYGESLIRIAAMAALGIEPPDNIRLRTGAVAYQFHVLPPRSARRLIRIEGLDKVTSMFGVTQLCQNHQPGDTTDWRLGSLEYVVSIRGSASDHDELQNVHAQILQQLQLEYS